MKKVFLVVFLSLSHLYAITLDVLISQALEKNPSLESIEYRISANESNIDISNQFSNPNISYSQNTLDKSEKMAKKTLSLQQKISFYGKRDSLKNVAIADEEILNQNLIQAKVNLVMLIKEQSFTIWKLESLYKIILDYEDLTRQNIELAQSYTSTSDNQHMGIMSAQLSLSDLKIQKSVLNAKIQIAYAKLSYLAAFKITKLDLKLRIDEMPKQETLTARLVNNTTLNLRQKEIEKNQALIASAEVNNYPDINLLASYSFRENFDNYATFGVGINLPIYATEDYKEEYARSLVLSAESLKEDTFLAIDSELQSLYSQMKSQYEIYHIIHDEALPQVSHMLELDSSSISTGSNLFNYIETLVKKIKLEEKSIDAIGSFHQANAKISALLGEIK